VNQTSQGGATPRTSSAPSARRPATGGTTPRSWPDGGAGLSVAARDIRASHLDRLITDAALVAGARAVAEEIAAMPDPERVAADLPAATSS
jgi:hypothetical protein